MSVSRRFIAQALTLFCLLIASALASAAPVVLVIGDSLSAAYGLKENAGWVHLLRERLAKHNPRYEVVNASISGDTTRGGVTRIDKALKQHKPRVVIIELGGNDGLRGMPLTGMRNNLDSMVTTVKQSQAKPLLVGVELPPNYGPAYTRQFMQVFQEVAKKHNAPLAPSIFAGFAEKREFFQPDGIHPLASAQPIILETIWKELAPLL